MDPQSRLAVVLIGTRNPLNIGAVARAMSNFGFFDLRLVDPYDAAFREAVSGVGAHNLLQKAIIYPNLESALSGCTLTVGTAGIVSRQPELPVLRLERGARLLKRHLSSDKAAILFGSEKHGLSNADISHCNLLLRIPTRAEHESMNLGQAVAITLYELTRQPRAARRLPREAEPADAEALERLTLLMKETLQISSEGQFGDQKSGEEKLRQLVRRARIRQDDAAIWTGHLRQILWKLKNPA
jgi:TrmH family RNA methyltransferase